MNNVTIIRSNDLEPNMVTEIVEVFEPFEVSIESYEYMCRNATGGPTFIQVLVDLATWELVLKISVTAFLAELSKSAAQDFWKNKKKIAEALSSPVVKPLKLLVKSISNAKKNIKGEAPVTVGLPYPDDHFGCVIGFETESEEEIAFKISIFVQNLELIEKTLTELKNSENYPIGPIILELTEDQKLFINWFGQKELNHCKKEIKQANN